MTLLVTGFSIFPAAPANPTERLALSMAGARTAAGEAIAAAVLPVEWDGAWPALRRAIRAERPRAVLMFGLHSRIDRLRIELLAHNTRELGRADAAGAYPSGPAVAEGPESLATSLPLERIAKGLRTVGADFELSRDAGRYLCNDTLYRLCLNASAEGVEHVGFVHAPLTDEMLGTWQAAGVLPDPCRTLPAEALRRAAVAIGDAIPPP